MNNAQELLLNSFTDKASVVKITSMSKQASHIERKYETLFIQSSVQVQTKFSIRPYADAALNETFPKSHVIPLFGLDAICHIYRRLNQLSYLMTATLMPLSLCFKSWMLMPCASGQLLIKLSTCKIKT